MGHKANHFEFSTSPVSLLFLASTITHSLTYTRMQPMRSCLSFHKKKNSLELEICCEKYEPKD